MNNNLKIKIFTSHFNYYREQQNKINKWIKEDNPKIINILQSGYSHITITFFYE